MKSMISKRAVVVATFAAIVVGGVAVTLNQAAAQREGKEPPGLEKKEERNLLRALAVIDSRLVDVPRPCTADQVTVIPDSVAGEGGTCEDAKADCRAKLADKVADKADTECKLYKKIDDRSVQCRAYRGNFDPTTKYPIRPRRLQKERKARIFRCSLYEPNAHKIHL